MNKPHGVPVTSPSPAVNHDHNRELEVTPRLLYEVVIRELADCEAAAVDLIYELVEERDSYRLLAQQLLHTLHRTIAAERHHTQRNSACEMSRRKARERRR